nr:uncharacterized protein LOC114825090 [Malus domestica]
MPILPIPPLLTNPTNPTTNPFHPFSTVVNIKLDQTNYPLWMTKKGDVSIMDYLDHMNAIIDNLALAGQPVNDDELMQIVLNNLGPISEITLLLEAEVDNACVELGEVHPRPIVDFLPINEDTILTTTITSVTSQLMVRDFLVQITAVQQYNSADFNNLCMVAIQQPLEAACSICSMTTHDFFSCPHIDACSEFTAEQVNAFNNFQRPRNDPYSNFYNSAWEIAIEKLSTITNARFEQTNQEIQNMHATMKNMEQQIWQIALQVSERSPGTFPSQTALNPRGQEEYNAIHTLRFCAATRQIQKYSISYHKNYITCLCASNAYPERLKLKAKDQQLTDFMKTLAKVQINLPSIDAIKNIPSYAKFLKDVFTKKKKLVDSEKVILMEQCNAVLLHKLPSKKKDPMTFTISCTIGNCDFSSALIDLGASVNLMPYSVFKCLGEGELKLTSSIIQFADRSITYPRGVIEDVIVKVDNLYLPADFMVLDMDEDLTTPIILGCPFLATARTHIDVEAGTLTFWVEDQTVVFRLFEATTHLGDKQ